MYAYRKNCVEKKRYDKEIYLDSVARINLIQANETSKKHEVHD